MYDLKEYSNDRSTELTNPIETENALGLLLYLGGKHLGNHDRGHRPACLVKPHTRSNGFPNCGFYTLPIFDFPKLKGIGDGTVAHLGDNQFDLHFLLKP